MQQYGNNGRPYGQNRDSLRSSGSSQRTTPPNDGASDTSRYGFNGEPLSRPPARTANGTVRRTRTDNSIEFPTQPRPVRDTGSAARRPAGQRSTAQRPRSSSGQNRRPAQRPANRNGRPAQNSRSAARLQQQEQVLCVVNTRRAAREVFHQLSGSGNFHLSTLMYPAHRKRILDEIRRRLRDGLPCRVVSTSLIEAGVDVDFPAVYRELSGLDSILQAAGRCNREGKRPPEDSIVTIFQGEDPPPRLFETSIGAGKIVLDHCQDVSSRAAIHTYFSTLLDLKGAEAQDAHHILPLMESEFFPFRTVAERFHLIESPTTTVYLPLEEGAGLVELLRSGQYSRTLYRRLGQYGVSVYPQHLAALEQAGALEHLEDGSVVLRDIGLYTQTTGLTLEPSGGNALFIG